MAGTRTVLVSIDEFTEQITRTRKEVVVDAGEQPHETVGRPSAGVNADRDEAWTKRRLRSRRATITDRPNRGFSKGMRYKAAFVAGVGAFILTIALIGLGSELLG